MMRTDNVWTLEDDVFLREHFSTWSYDDLCIVLGVSKDALRYRCYKIGLLRRESMIRAVRDQEYMDRCYREVNG